MTIIKVSELTGAALDWAVAKCAEINVIRCGAGPSQYLAYIPKRSQYRKYSPSTNWVQGGPIIERELITVQPVVKPVGWMARNQKDGCVYEGPTPLIAAMRCYVVSKLGDEVEVPEELV